MKTLFIGLVIGAIAVWSWYHTGGKIYITETKTITNEVVITVTETQIVEQSTSYITRTNVIWKTNVVEIIQPPKVVTEKPVVQVQPKTAQPAPAQKLPSSGGLKGARPSGKVTVNDPRRIHYH